MIFIPKIKDYRSYYGEEENGLGSDEEKKSQRNKRKTRDEEENREIHPCIIIE